MILLSISIGLLSACGEESTESVTKKETVQSEVSKAEQEEQLKEQQALEEQERLVEDSKSLEALQAYYDKAQPLIEQYAGLMDMFNDQVNAATIDPTLNINPDWIFETDSILYEVGWVSDDFLEIEAPPEHAESNKFQRMAFEEAKFFSENYITAVQNFDFALLDECQAAITLSAEYAEQSRIAGEAEHIAMFGSED